MSEREAEVRALFQRYVQDPGSCFLGQDYGLLLQGLPFDSPLQWQDPASSTPNIRVLASGCETPTVLDSGSALLHRSRVLDRSSFPPPSVPILKNLAIERFRATTKLVETEVILEMLPAPSSQASALGRIRS